MYTLIAVAILMSGSIFPLFAFSIALPVNGSRFFAVNEQRYPFDSLCRKDMDVGRERYFCLPSFQRVVIAKDGKDLNLMLGQFMKQPHVIELGREIVIGTGIDVTRNQNGVNLFIDSQLYDFLKGPDRSFADDTLPAIIDGGQIMERAS